MLEMTGKRKTGRPRVEEYIPPEKIIKAFKVHGNSYRAAQALGIHTDTVSRVLRDHNIDPQGPERKLKNIRDDHYSAFAKFVKAYNDTLPRSVREIYEIAQKNGFKEVSINTVKCYLYRRRKRYLKRLEELPDLREVAFFLQDYKGELVATQDILTYTYRVDTFSLDISIYAKLHNGEETVFEVESPGEFIATLRGLS